MKSCNNTNCLYNKDHVCYMYNDKTDADRTYYFYEKWYPEYLKFNRVNVAKPEDKKPKVHFNNTGATYL